jgi:CRISPR-associated endoribonuclease Cas6
MRVRIICDILNSGGTVPFHHQYLLSDLIDSIKGKEFEKFTLYTFSGLKSQTKCERDGLVFTANKLTFVLASQNVLFIKKVLIELFKFKQITISKLIIKPVFVEKEVIPKMKDETKFLSISPIMLMDPRCNNGNGMLIIDPTTDDFSDYLYECTMDRMEASGLYSDDQLNTFFKFQIEPDTTYLKKMESSNKKISRIYSVFEERDAFEVRGYTFPFTLFAAPEVQDFILNNGLGCLTHKGYGMVDLADQSSKSTVDYNFKYI